jgi:hypothetical protein
LEYPSGARDDNVMASWKLKDEYSTVKGIEQDYGKRNTLLNGRSENVWTDRTDDEIRNTLLWGSSLRAEEEGEVLEFHFLST